MGITTADAVYGLATSSAAAASCRQCDGLGGLAFAHQLKVECCGRSLDMVRLQDLFKRRRTSRRIRNLANSVLQNVNEPDICYCQNSHAPGQEIRQRGRHAVVVSGRTVITVLFHGIEYWQASVHSELKASA